MPPVLGCIADDYTGAAELSSTLQRAGLRTTLLFGEPDADGPPDAEAVVVALKTRTVPVDEAVRQSLEALRWLRAAGASQIYFKYCSTFDSTPAGNIGPVAQALLEELDADWAMLCPVTPEQGRTVYQGHLFVHDRLLAETHMRHHPLTPMRDSDLRRLLADQTERRVDLLTHQIVTQGATTVSAELRRLSSEGADFIVTDATDESDLAVLAEAGATTPLATGAVGLARAMAHRIAATDHTDRSRTPAPPSVDGAEAILSGSCSARTLEQVEHARGAYPSFRIDAAALAAGEDTPAQALAWAERYIGATPVLIYSTTTPDQLRPAGSAGAETDASALVEAAMGGIARGLVERGVRRLVVAGGETTGAVVTALGIRSVEIGPEADPSVPWTFTRAEPRIALVPKSGNFGGPDLFVRAFRADSAWDIEPDPHIGREVDNR